MFESQNGDFDIKKEHINGNGEYVITAGLSNNGILGKTDIKAKIFEPKTITIDMFGCAFYRQFQYKMVTHARVFSLKPLFEITDKQGIFLSCSLNFLRYLFGYENMCSWEKIKNHKIKLPITQNGEIDFDFMESFISEIEEGRVCELEAYLKVTGLTDTTLTQAEQKAIEAIGGEYELNSKTWSEFELGKLFTFKGIKQSKSQKEIPTDQNGIPYIVQSTTNNMCSRYVNKQYLIDTNELPNKGNAIVLGVTLPAISYQPKEFGASQIIEARSDFLNKQNGLFFVTAIYKQMYQFSYQNKPGIEIYKNLKIKLPITANGEIDFEFMESFISGVQKISIKGVIGLKDKIIEQTKKAI
ncbi:restriction endonuclease subunit S [Campylobacter hyointestinalis]|uniref:restriction endonuclease subunit S n=1 Tax=Campylobacter hyointestinalis TaxID=198 RepID=UPI00215D5781|nr:restriction endonuclease subunit S [Campylobacter hyointestinalis]